MGLCDKISKEDIETFAEMMVCLEYEHDAQAGENMEKLSKYGNDIKDIQQNMLEHISECKPCNNHYQESYESNTRFFRFLWRNFNTPENLSAITSNKKWNLEHSIFEDPKGLKDYIFTKALAENRESEFKENDAFEEHIKACECCQEKYRLNLKHISKHSKN
ncbi:hypothetical protein KY332_05385 [Candidatus Woesearchaeota archaeon]|nr:hypothetical protein [Candidatus Woesearchaeota archaeon]